MLTYPISMFRADSGPLDPITLNPFAWYDADDASTITIGGGGDVDQWDDKSGNGFNLIPGGGMAKPQTGTETIGGLNTIAFDGNDDTLFNLSFAVNTANISYVFVRRANANNGARSLAIMIPGNTGLLNEHLIDSTDVLAGYRFPENEGVQWTPSSQFDPMVNSYVKTGTNSQEAWQDGVAKGTNVTNITTFNSQQLFVGSSDLSNADVDIGELLIFDRALSTADRVALENYALNKWSI